MKLERIAAMACLGAGVLVLTAFSTYHLKLTKSAPSADVVLTDSPAMVQVWFNQDVQLSVSGLGLRGPGGAVELGDVESTDDAKSFLARIEEALAAGEYTVSWRTAGDDGHVQRGRYTFAVQATQSEER